MFSARRSVIIAFTLLLVGCASAHAQTGCVPNPNDSGPPFVDGCRVSAVGLNKILNGPVLSVTGVQAFMGNTNALTSWQHTFYPNTVNVGAPVLNVLSPGGNLAIVAATRASDNTNLDNIALMGLALNNNTSNVSPAGAWGASIEADRLSGVSTPTQGVEIDIGNSGSVVDVDSANANAFHPAGLTADLWLACGGAGGGGGTAACSVAIGILPTVSQPFRTGIGFQTNALDPNAPFSGGNGTAMKMATGQSVVWETTSGTLAVGTWGLPGGGFAINCNSQTLPATATNQMSICANGSGGGGEINFINQFTTASAAFQFTQMTGVGTNTNILTLSKAGALLPAVTFGSLPTCNSGTKYYISVVTDLSAAPTYRQTGLTGGGSTPGVVFCNGSAYEAH